MDRIQEIIAWIMDRVALLISEAKLVIKKHDFFSILTAVTVIVKVVEEAASQFKGLTGKEKQQIAVTVLNRLIDIPFIPESMEQWLFEYVVDLVVGRLNLTEWKKAKPAK